MRRRKSDCDDLLIFFGIFREFIGATPRSGGAQGALEEESAGSPCVIGRREKGEDMPTGLMGVNP